ncbi:MAG TPA: hypothetical protein VM764_11040 [Gemmatimonadaceae bacterium]|jgi:hypothetical protein|nr:hypothetical protein [Gemmatimonadaceae bacterium]
MLFSLYAALAVFGLLFVGWGLFAGDFGADGGDGSDFDDSHHGGLWALFSIRTLAFAALAFGATGLLGRLSGWSTITTLAMSSALGAGTWLGVGALFTYLRRTQSGSLLSDSSWIGSEAVLVLPFGRDGLGRISLTAGGQVTELFARRAPAYEEYPSEAFARCQIDQLEDGLALVIPLTAKLTA